MKHFKIYLMAFVALLSAVAFNSVAGATIFTVLGGNALTGAITGNAVSLLAGSFMPKGAMLDGVFAEIWTGQMIKAFRTAAESLGWYDRIKSYDQYVDADVIHFTEIGGDPTVLVNNTTYPLEIETLEDADKPISLDKFDTTATPVTDDELHACSYDKMASVLERHRAVLREKVCEKAIHAIAPTKKMPKADRILVLCSDHVNDLLETEQKFKEHYNINQTEGKIARLYGFDIYEYDGTPYYNTSTNAKLAWGATPASATDRQCSVFYYNGRMMKANGSVQFYHSEARQDPLYHRNLVNFRKWGICMPLTEKNSVGAIVSAKAS